eukprot:gnl/MRDRNA2_/MRDRNA2_31334_c0_seq1.p1 gnl/MRDRNA2_/MRDRNA2_31334_c0~~gnl/MRDRNA2_/MRDRNA2_31334_c0_seq1.p1  ORF type:complete len:579 (-),score=114.42 gnl/MRDRNA2_/MRDRNA2_31334_c0_seq1:141-1877(-)
MLTVQELRLQRFAALVLGFLSLSSHAVQMLPNKDPGEVVAPVAPVLTASEPLNPNIVHSQPQDDVEKAELQRLMDQISGYKAYDPATAEQNLYMRWVDYAGREDVFVPGVRVQVRGSQLFYKPAPPDILDSKNPAHKDMFSWWQQTSAHVMVFLRKTLKKYGSLGFVDATYIISDLCRDHGTGESHAERMFYDASFKHQAFFSKHSEGLPGVGEDIAPAFSWNARKECRVITVPNYDWNHYSENFTDGSIYRLDTGAKPMPWKTREAKLVWRGEQLAWDGSRPRALRLGILHPELMDVKTTSPMGSGECSWYSETIQNANLKYATGDLIKDCQGIWGGPTGFMPQRAQESHKYILDMDGGGSTFRLKNLLLGGWLIFRVQSGMEQYFGPELKPYEHFIPVSLQNFEADLLEKLDWAKKNDAEAERIANNARNYAEKELHDDRAEWYHWTALSVYSKWQTPSEDSVRSEPSNSLFQRFCCKDVLQLASWQPWAQYLEGSCPEEDSKCSTEELMKRLPSWLMPAVAQNAAKGAFSTPEYMWERPAEPLVGSKPIKKNEMLRGSSVVALNEASRTNSSKNK